MPRLLVLDGLGGPDPGSYGPVLGALAELEIVCLPTPFRDEAASRLERLAAYGAVTRCAAPADVVPVALDRARAAPVDGIVCLNETLLAPAAEVAEQLGLPFTSVAAASVAQRKDLQRRCMHAAGLPMPRWARVDDRASLARAAELVGLPALLKPVTGFGGVATQPVQAVADLVPSYERLRSLYLAEPRMRDLVHPTAAAFLLEQVLAGRPVEDPRLGDYVSVESLVVDGAPTHVAVMDKLALAEPFRETGSLLPSRLDDDEQDELRAVASRAIAATGIEFGATHTEIKLTAGGPRVIEVNGRLGGPTAKLLALCAGYDIVAELGRMALGQRPRRVPAWRAHAAFVRLPAPARAVRVRAVRGVERARALPGVVELSLRQPPGSEPDWRIGGRSGLLRAVVVADSAQDLLARIDGVRDAVAFEFEELRD